jgi:glutathione S-transferase
VCWLPYVEYLFASGGGDLVEARSNVSAWWKRVSGRPSWKTASGKGG